MKKILAMVLSLAIVASLAITGTVAYLQDSVGRANTMSIGNVLIKQHELKRKDPLKIDTTEDLIVFQQRKALLPAVGGYANYAKLSDDGNYKFFVGDDNKPTRNVMDKIITIENTGDFDAYVRTIIAFEAPMFFDDDQKEMLVHLLRNELPGGSNFGNHDWTWEWLEDDSGKRAFIDIKDDGTQYHVAVVTSHFRLAPGKTTTPSLLQVGLDSKATNEHVNKYGDTYDILVVSQAVQADGFDTVGNENSIECKDGTTVKSDLDDAKAALNTAFNKAAKATEGPTVEDIKAWLADVESVPFAKVTVLNKNDKLTTKDKNDANKEVTILDKDLTIDTSESKMGVDIGDAVSLDTLYQFEPSMNETESANSEYAKWKADFYISVDKDVPPQAIALAGYYNAWCELNNYKWVALAVDETIQAGTSFRLVQLISPDLSIFYDLLCQEEYGNDGIGFLCGAVALDKEKAKGITLNVELRLYETEFNEEENEWVETGENNYVSTGTYTYTF